MTMVMIKVFWPITIYIYHNIIETRMDHLDLHGGDELLLAHYPVSRLVFFAQYGILSF